MYNKSVLTVIETVEFTAQANAFWREDERHAFIDWIAEHPDAGDVIPGSGGCRKVRWSVAGRGKRGGARVIYFHFSARGELLLLATYIKAERSTLPGHVIRKALEHET